MGEAGFEPATLGLSVLTLPILYQTELLSRQELLSIVYLSDSPFDRGVVRSPVQQGGNLSAPFLARAPGRDRTCGLLIRSQLLYPLSYGGLERTTRLELATA